MNSWEIIKSRVRGTPGSAGYQAGLVIASDLFCEILPMLSDRVRAERAYCEDLELAEALLNAPGLREIGLLK